MTQDDIEAGYVARLEAIQQLLEGAYYDDPNYDAAYFQVERWIVYTTSPPAVPEELARLKRIREQDAEAWARLRKDDWGQFRSRLCGVVQVEIAERRKKQAAARDPEAS